ncbi:hypothetical protein QAD02_012330 [Eretmocerus hayati]|uniref:Uncharacterized protein n=1 Tax=Eretmocerus hayati TaxID=131215 RepID=A0ACC2P091_9HYME|nr:hypothetical protein QAD02_012330 [Eretmocerus hayati]
MSLQFKMFVKFIIFTTVLSYAHAYRILGIFPLNGPSHNMLFRSLMTGLARRGHQVDVITHFPEKSPPKNYKDVVDLSGTMGDLTNNFTIDFIMGVKDDIVVPIATLYGNNLCDLMGLKEIQEIIHSPPRDPPYDVIITEVFGANCFMGIGYHLKIPVVIVSSALEYPWINDLTGNDDNPATVPNALFTAFGGMNFWQRLQNTVMYHNEVKKFHALTETSQTESMRKHINPNMPSIRVIEKNSALILVNSHHILFGVKPALPTLVPIGGLHVEESDSTLSKDLQKWMDQSRDGVVYFTFGSMVITESLPENILSIFFNCFAKLSPTRVLMKIADKSKVTLSIPENILSMPWIPQRAVLAHNNTRAFVTHGGLMGTFEALYYGIPMIGVPLFADQPRNVEALVAKNMSIKLPFDELTEESLDAALATILFDAKYKKSAEHYSKLFRDQPMSAMTRAAYWIEYVARNGPDSLRPPSLELTWWQLALLDVYGFIISIAMIVMVISYLGIRFVVLNLIFGPTHEVRSKKLN